MSWLSFIPILGPILNKILPDKNKELDREIAEITSEGNLEVEKAKNHSAPGEIIKGEVRGNFLQSSWRPLLMYIFIFIIFNNSLLVPIFDFYFSITLVELQFPQDLPQEIMWAISGYMGFRTVEKVTKVS